MLSRTRDWSTEKKIRDEHKLFPYDGRARLPDATSQLIPNRKIIIVYIAYSELNL